jgi:hypothetical protein
MHHEAVNCGIRDHAYDRVCRESLDAVGAERMGFAAL